MAPVAAPAALVSVSRLRELQPLVSQLGRRELAETLAPLVERFHEGFPDAEAPAAVETALAFCRGLYADARSSDALPLARAILEQATRHADPGLVRKAATACGLLSADAADLVGAIEHHVQALRLTDAAGDALEKSGVWNNIGLALGIAGNYEMAGRCYQRALALVEPQPAPLYRRYAFCINLAQSLLQVGSIEEGLRYAQQALDEQTDGLREQDLHSALLLRRNVVRLLIAAGRTAEAQPHVTEAVALAERTRTPRARIAAMTTRAVYELATGNNDVALTRLEQALAQAREVPAALRDTLACVIRAEEAAGNTERALVRLGELSDHIYRAAIDRARQGLELASMPAKYKTRLDLDQEQARARLVSKVGAPANPDSWGALERLAVSAVMRIDETGWHGKRVGALTKALAMATGTDPLRALEMGMAAELHDIGMMSIPEGILRKRAPLNAAERGIVQRHADAAGEILRDDRHPRVFLAREIARYHHAHWDGGGHPEHVGGKLIPLAARICAVADAYDAMMCGVGHGPSRNMDEALAELHREAGRQFDPDLVVAFDRMIRLETEDLGMDLGENAGMESFQELVNALQEDRGFV